MFHFPRSTTQHDSSINSLKADTEPQCNKPQTAKRTTTLTSLWSPSWYVATMPTRRGSALTRSCWNSGCSLQKPVKWPVLHLRFWGWSIQSQQNISQKSHLQGLLPGTKNKTSGHKASGVRQVNHIWENKIVHQLQILWKRGHFWEDSLTSKIKLFWLPLLSFPDFERAQSPRTWN